MHLYNFLVVSRNITQAAITKAVLLSTVCVYGAADLGPGFGEDSIPTVDAGRTLNTLKELRGLKPLFEMHNSLLITPSNCMTLLQHLAFYEGLYAGYNEGVHLKDWGAASDTNSLVKILNSFNALTSLKLSSEFANSGAVLSHLLRFNERIETLDLSGCQLRTATLTDVVNRLSEGSSLRLKHLDLRGNALTVEQRAALLRRYPQATILTDATTPGMTQVAFGTASVTAAAPAISDSELHALTPGVGVQYVPDSRPLKPQAVSVSPQTPETAMAPLHYEEEKVLRVTGQDGRQLIKATRTWPYSSIVKLHVTFPGGERVTGSGVMVGPRHVLTAGHYVFYEKGWATMIETTPGLYGKDQPFGTSQGTHVYTTKQWATGLNKPDNLALIVLGDDLGRRTGWFGLQGDGVSLGRTLSLSGYPIDKGAGTTLWQMDGSIDRVEKGLAYYRIDTEKGQGGGPLWYNGEQGPMVVGVHAYRQDTENSGIVLTAEKLALVRQWIWSTWERKEAQTGVVEKVLDDRIHYTRHPDRSYLSMGATQLKGQKSGGVSTVSIPAVDDSTHAYEKALKTGGEDRRRYVRATHEWPYSSMVQIQSRFKDQTVTGSGVMVGPAHVLTIDPYLFKAGQWAQQVEARAGLNGKTEPFGSVPAARLVRLAPIHGNETSSMGLLVLQQNLGEQTGWLGMDGTPTTTYPAVEISGYPGDKGNGKTLWSADGAIDRMQENTLEYTIDTSQGQEGGPIWVTRGDERYVIGLNAGETETTNVGVRVTPERLTEIAAYIQQHWRAVQPEGQATVQHVAPIHPVSAPAQAPAPKTVVAVPQAPVKVPAAPLVQQVVQPDAVFAQQEFERGLVEFKKQKYGEARAYFERCANWHHADALNYLGVMYEQGYGVAVNPETARVYYERGANLGSGQACSNLGDYYGHKNDTNTAMRWFKRGAELGHQGCQDNLDMYDAGV